MRVGLVGKVFLNRLIVQIVEILVTKSSVAKC